MSGSANTFTSLGPNFKEVYPKKESKSGSSKKKSKFSKLERKLRKGYGK